MSSAPARVSVIVPTFREAANLVPLADRLFAAMQAAGLKAELIIVDDDSQDGTEEIAAELATRHPVVLIVRRRERGLSSAVLAGMTRAGGEILVVMDADLQHPPELAPQLVQRLVEGDHDFALGTRYADGGTIDERWPWYRRLASGVATALARPLTPLSDPMSGFFAMRAEAFRNADRLNPCGYKIGLELYVKAGCSRPVEVPIRFARRAAGTSKFGVRQQAAYALHIGRLYRYRFPPVVWVSGVLFAALAVLAARLVMK